jgi:hypothetical protein
MALTVGDKNVSQGVSLIIYTAIDAALRPPMVQGMQSATPPATVDQIATAVASAQANWKNLAFGIAGGIVTSLTQNPPASPAPPSPVFASTFSSSAQDAAFWPWLVNLLRVFTTTWAPTTADGVNLQNALKAFIAANAIPQQLTGVVQ